MLKLEEVVPEELLLGPVKPSTSGAAAQWEGGVLRLQTPWLRVQSMTTYENGKTCIFLDVHEDVASWVIRLEERVKAGLADSFDVDSAWRTSITEDGWKLSIPSNCQRFGDELQVGSWVAISARVAGGLVLARMCRRQDESSPAQISYRKGARQLAPHGEGPGSRLLPGHICGGGVGTS